MADEARADGTQPGEGTEPEPHADEHDDADVPEDPPPAASAATVATPIPAAPTGEPKDIAASPERDGERAAADTKNGAAETKNGKEAKEGRRRFETLLPNLIRRGIEKSIEAGLNTFEKSLETGRETAGTLREATSTVREAFSEVNAPRDVAHAVGKALTEAKLPRELASAVFTQIDETKNDVLRIIAKEFRDFLEATDIATELKNALTSLSFEIRTEVRFIPNEAGTGVKADVQSRTRVKRTPHRERERRRGRYRVRQPAPDYYEDDDEE